MDVLYTDDLLLVLNKPAGVAVIPEGWEPDAPALVRMAEEAYGKLWIVHRLDKGTSGVLLFARTAEAHRGLNRQFELRETSKTYHAVVHGRPTWKMRNCRLPLRANVGHKHRTQVDRRNGKPASTRFSVLQEFPEAALLEAIPLTGRTHQIRAHAAILGHPLLGDRLYGASKTPLIDRPALHALSITIKHPVSASQMTFEAPYPEDLRAAVATLKVQRS